MMLLLQHSSRVPLDGRDGTRHRDDVLNDAFMHPAGVNAGW
jgi:hypothetical protein